MSARHCEAHGEIAASRDAEPTSRGASRPPRAPAELTAPMLAPELITRLTDDLARTIALATR